MKITMLETFSPKPSSEKIAAIEEKYNINLPKEYKYFIEKYNGGKPEKRYFNTKDNKVSSLVNTFFPLEENGEDNLIDEYNGITLANQIPINMIPIADTPPGNRVVMSISGEDVGCIYYWAWGEEDDPPSCSYRYMRIIADSFNDFLSMLTQNRT